MQFACLHFGFSSSSAALETVTMVARTHTLNCPGVSPGNGDAGIVSSNPIGTPFRLSGLHGFQQNKTQSWHSFGRVLV
jgi:hypothetical protein